MHLLRLFANFRGSDREHAGLQGPVRIVSEGPTRTEFGPAGNLITRRWLANPNSESIEARTYDDAGRLLAVTVRDGSGVVSEQAYSYDGKGRLLRITEASGDRTSIEYDESGRKIEIRDLVDKADARKAAAATGIDVVFADVEATYELGLDGTGNASRIKNIYDEHDLPVETQALDAEGHLLSRILRAYDEKQRISDVRIVIDDPTSLFPAKQAELASQLNAPIGEMRAHLKATLGAMMGEPGSSHTYNSHGLRTKTVLRHRLLGEVSRTYSHNEHGDVVEERTSFSRALKLPVGVPLQVDTSGNVVPGKPQSEWPPQPEFPDSTVTYKYRYDRYGNWTEQTITNSLGWDHTRRRELEYY